MRFLIGAATALCLALPAYADPAIDAREARVSIAREYVEATMKDMDIQDFIRQLWTPMIQQMANNP